MKKLEEMRLAEILSQLGVCLARRSLYDIWKDDSMNIPVQKTESNPEGKHALEILYTGNYADEFSEDTKKLGRFLFEHEEEIDNIKLVMTILRNYKEALASNKLSPEIARQYEKYISVARKMLKGIDKTFVHYTWEDRIGRIEELIITDTKSESEGKPRARKLKNIERLAALEREENLGNITQALTTLDVGYIIPYQKEVGVELRFMIEYNSLLNTVNGDHKRLSQLIKIKGFDKLVAETDGSEFIEEMTMRIREYIEEIDIDRMLLCAGLRYLEGIERGGINRKNAPEVYRRLAVIQKHLKKNAEISFKGKGEGEISYSARDLETDMKRFIKEGDTVRYLTLEQQRRTSNKNSSRRKFTK